MIVTSYWNASSRSSLTHPCCIAKVIILFVRLNASSYRSTSVLIISGSNRISGSLNNISAKKEDSQVLADRVIN